MKKGSTNWQIVGLILFVVGLAITLIIIGLIFFGDFAVEGIQERATDTFCAIGVRGRSYIQIKGALGFAELHAFPEFCRTRPKDIEPDEFRACPYYGRMKDVNIEKGLINWKDVKVRREYFKKCAAEQFARIAVKCWKTRGAGKLDPGNFECYSVCIKATGDLTKLEKELATAEGEYYTAKDAYDRASSKDYPGVSETEVNKALELKKTAMEDAKLNLDKLTEEYDETDKVKHAISFNEGFLKDTIKEANYTKEQKIKDILGPDYVRFAGEWDNLGIGGRLPWDTGSSDISSSKIISIFFKDNWKTLFGLKEMENDAIVLRYKGRC